MRRYVRNVNNTAAGTAAARPLQGGPAAPPAAPFFCDDNSTALQDAIEEKNLEYGHAICRACFVSYPRNTGVDGRYCSEGCQKSDIGRIKKCKPKCEPDSKIINEVTFRDGTKHMRESCKLCKRARYVPRPKNKEKKLEQERIKKHKAFLFSKEWKILRYKTLARYGSQCMACRTTVGVMHVDHIKPRWIYPSLALDPENLQILCSSCNIGKGAWDETDWRGMNNAKG